MDKLLDADRQEFMREQNSKIRPDEQIWEEIDFDETEFKEWQKARFEKKQQELSVAVIKTIQESIGDPDYIPSGLFIP